MQIAAHQSGERDVSLPEAFTRAASAVAELGMTFELTAGLDASPGMWRCVLRKSGRELPRGQGAGKGDRDAARAGALFEALEHHLSGLDGIEDGAVVLRDPADVARGLLARDVAVAMLAEHGAERLACWRFRGVGTDTELDVPIFLSLPEYVEHEGAVVRDRLGDRYDYRRVGRYACNNGWAAGCDTVDATVHALNEAIERDSLSMLLIGQFLDRRGPLRLIDPATLPLDLTALLARAREVTGRPVHIVDMTTDLGVPAILAFQSPPPGRPAHIRGCGASLSLNYAITRALTELVQCHVADQQPNDLPTPYDQTAAYPALHACHLADLTPMLASARMVAYDATDVPDTPAGHRDRLVEILTTHGFRPCLREHHVTDDIAVVNVIVPGLERFMLITDGILVIPGERGRGASRHRDA